ncbi:hypothetical protein JOM56_012416 [Amanita muscaria]
MPRIVPKSTKGNATDTASVEEDPTISSRPSRQAKKAALEKAVWKPKKRPAIALPARRPSAKRRCTPSRKGKLNKKEESENEPVDIPVPSAPKKPRKKLVYVSVSEDSNSEVSVSESDSSEAVGEDDDIENVFNDGDATEPDIQANEGGINLDDVAVTALARRVLAERPQWASQSEGDAVANGLFEDDSGSDPESPSASLAANKENIPPAPLALSPSPPPPPPPTPTPLPEVSNTQWPYYAQLNYHQTNSGLDLGLSRQHHEIKLVVRRAIETITERIIFEDAFPAPAKRTAWIFSALLAAVKFVCEIPGVPQNRYERLRARIVQDPQFVQELSTMINPRVPLLRSQIKTLAVNNAKRVYDLQDMDANGIAALVNDLKFIFPFNQHGNVQGTKPYESAAIISTIRDFLFHNSTVRIELYPERFLAGEEANHALTPSVIALAATAVTAAIEEWRTGRRIVGTFTTNVYADVYRTHLAVLTRIHDENVQGYSALLRRLYLAAASPSNGMDTTLIPGSSFLDTTNMALEA